MEPSVPGDMGHRAVTYCRLKVLPVHLTLLMPCVSSSYALAIEPGPRTTLGASEGEKKTKGTFHNILM